MLKLTRLRINDTVHEVAGEEIAYNEVVLLAGYNGRPKVMCFTPGPEDPRAIAEGEQIPLNGDELCLAVSYT